MHGIEGYLDKSTSSSTMRHYIRSRVPPAQGASIHIVPSHRKVLEDKRQEDKHFKVGLYEGPEMGSNNKQIRCLACSGLWEI